MENYCSKCHTKTFLNFFYISIFDQILFYRVYAVINGKVDRVTRCHWASHSKFRITTTKKTRLPELFGISILYFFINAII